MKRSSDDQVTSDPMRDLLQLGRPVSKLQLAATLREMADRLIYDDLQGFRSGPTDSGPADITDKLEDMWNYSWKIISGRREHAVTLPMGDFVYRGDGLVAADGAAVRIVGASRGSTRLRLVNDVFLVKAEKFLPTMMFRDISIVGGKGAFLNASTQPAVGGRALGHRSFEGVNFEDYSTCAVQSRNADDPFYDFSRCKFSGKVESTAISLPPGGGHSISQCWFNRGRYYIHCRGAQDIRIGPGNRFGGLRKNSRRNAIWIEPLGGQYDGRGAVIFNNFFGNENLDAGDAFILFAAGMEGYQVSDIIAHSSDNTEKMLRGIAIHNNFFCCVSDQRCLIESFVPNVGSLRFADNMWSGYPRKIVQGGRPGNFLTALSSTNSFRFDGGPFNIDGRNSQRTTLGDGGMASVADYSCNLMPEGASVGPALMSIAEVSSVDGQTWSWNLGTLSPSASKYSIGSRSMNAASRRICLRLSITSGDAGPLAVSIWGPRRQLIRGNIVSYIPDFGYYYIFPAHFLNEVSRIMVEATGQPPGMELAAFGLYEAPN